MVRTNKFFSFQPVNRAAYERNLHLTMAQEQMLAKSLIVIGRTWPGYSSILVDIAYNETNEVSSLANVHEASCHVNEPRTVVPQYKLFFYRKGNCGGQPVKNNVGFFSPQGKDVVIGRSGPVVAIWERLSPRNRVRALGNAGRRGFKNCRACSTHTWILIQFTHRRDTASRRKRHFAADSSLD